MQSKYKIYFDGEIAPNFNHEEVKKHAQAIFNLSDEKVTQLFNGSTHTLKDNLSAQDCQQYLNNLLNIGLVGKSVPPLPNHSNNKEKTITDHSQEPSLEKKATHPQNILNKRNRPMLSLLLLALIVAVGGYYAWQEGYINFPDSEQPTVSTNPTQSLQIDSSVKNSVTENVIQECTNPEVSQLLEKVLAEGIPQLVQRSSPEINLTITDYANNQELYYDQTRNKRLCGVLAQFSINAPNMTINIENPSVVYEVIYEIQKENNNAVRLSTFRQKIISSNLQTTAEND